MKLTKAINCHEEISRVTLIAVSNVLDGIVGAAFNDKVSIPLKLVTDWQITQGVWIGLKVRVPQTFTAKDSALQTTVGWKVNVTPRIKVESLFVMDTIDRFISSQHNQETAVL